MKNKLMPILEYYQSRQINPVPIGIEDPKTWETHCIRRQNLYERHLKIPIPMFRGRSVIEFGCNSGENALYLASAGALLTLVEPNEQVLPRLRALFERFHLQGQIKALAATDIAAFKPQEQYDIMLAEGFLTMIPDRGRMLLKICSLLKPGGFGVISFDDRYGEMFEIIRQTVFRRVCRARGLADLHSAEALAAAKELFEEDFTRINSSRPFKAWWQDVLLNPYVSWEHLGTYHEFVALLQEAGCEVHATSPLWSQMDHGSWYKNVAGPQERHHRFLEDFYKAFPFLLTGLPFLAERMEPAKPQEVEAVSDFIKALSAYNFADSPFESIAYPPLMDRYFASSPCAELKKLNTEIKALLSLLGRDPQAAIGFYKQTEFLQRAWGMAGPYISFKKLT